MARNCSDCGEWLAKCEFSANQWRKGSSRCYSCVNGGSNHRSVSYQCQECYRMFNSQNELNMHMQTHRPRDIACPVCGEERFRSGANAVQHVESGYCRGCLGQDNARHAIYGFARQKQVMQRFMSDVPMLQNGRNTPASVPEFPYQCHDCAKSFRHLSQFLQHRDNKHNQQIRMIGY